MRNGWASKFPDGPEDFARATCSVAAAILGAGALGAGASIYGATKAAGAQTGATNAAANLQKQILGANFSQLAPFIGAGNDAVGPLKSWLNPDNPSGPLNALMRLTMPGANMTETLKQTPGYAFAEDRGLRSVNNALAARGLGGSGGAVAKGASEYVTGLASNTWQSVVNALQSLFTGGAGSMQNLVNTGANAAGNFAGGAIQSGNNIGGNLVGGGNAQGGMFTSIANAIGGFGNSASTAAILQKLLGNNNPASTGNAVPAGLYGTPEGGAWNIGATATG